MSDRGSQLSEDRVRPNRIALIEKLGATDSFVVLADGRRRLTQTVEATQEAAVRLMTPTHGTASPPACGPQRIQTTVVADPKVRVRLDLIVGQSTQLGPHFAELGKVSDDGGDCTATLVGR